MKLFFFNLLLLISPFVTISLQAQDNVIGIWVTHDDKSGEPRSHIEIYVVDGKLHGKVVKLLDSEPGVVCEKCKGDKKNKPVLGMEVMWGMKKDKENKWKGGKLLDPENGKSYKGKLELSKTDELKVRGFIGFSLLGRTQKWTRLKQ